MVPARLAIRNFLCYRDLPSLDLAHVRFACLTGENGNGKSALLDAMTWALWGRARGRTDADLLHTGTTELSVDFEFWAGESKYRVVRKHGRAGAKGSGRSDLQLQLWTGEGWQVQTGSVIAETQRKINDVLKLTYETFVNSAFVLQGKADLFTTKTPSERKQVLADILDLEQYDGYETRAKERKSALERATATLDRQIGDAEFELKKLPALHSERDQLTETIAGQRADVDATMARQRELSALVAAVEGWRRSLAAGERAREEAASAVARAEERAAARQSAIAEFEQVLVRAEEIRSGFAALGENRSRLAELEAEARRLQGDAGSLDRELTIARAEAARSLAQVAEREEEIAGYAAIRADAPVIQDGYARLLAARAAEAEHAVRVGHARELEARMRPLEQAVERAKAALQTRMQVGESTVASRGPVAARLQALQRERAAADGLRAELDRVEAEARSEREAEASGRAKIQALHSENERLKEEMTAFRRKRDDLKAAAQHGDVECPLCGAEMGAERLEQVRDSYQQQNREREERYKANRGRADELEAARAAHASRAAALDEDVTRRRAEMHRRAGGLDRRIAEAEEATSGVAAATADVEEVRGRLRRGVFAVQEQHEIADLREELARIGYDRAEHEAVRRAIVTLEPWVERHQRLADAEARYDVAAGALAREQEIAQAADARVTDLEGRLDETRTRLAGLPLDRARAAVEAQLGFEAEHERLRIAETGIGAAKEVLAGALDTIAVESRRRDEADEMIADLRAQLAQAPDAHAALQECDERVRLAQSRLEGMRQALGGTEQEIDRLEELERVTSVRKITRAARADELSIYDDLVRAFGKRGVQALLIEAVLPEIEDVANDLLARMTNNRMNITLETVKQNLKGTVQETLDIRIADEWGTRGYEMFSGGEAFRINLALRIALSRLLARRAGAPLRTLVIDEGFGTQDAAARERLIESINAIQDQFDCLLVVTHIDELKELFDTRIEVLKSGEGSTARVVSV